MHTPIDELQEEDEDSQKNEDDADSPKIQDLEEEIKDRGNNNSSRIRMTGSTVQTPSFLEKN